MSDAGGSSLSDSWFLLQSGACAPAFNMALDEALLGAMPRLNHPVLRFYGWTESAATFGYFQRYGEVAATTHLRPLIRRPTGGGIVPHDADWTYSLTIPPGHGWYALKAIESYRRIHEWIRTAFSLLKVSTSLAPCCKHAGPGQCFVGYEKFDLLWQGKKIAGAAQRRTRNGLLIQGSVQPPPLSLQRSIWEGAMRAALPDDSTRWRDWSLDDLLRDRAEGLVSDKYSQAHYNQKR